MQGNFQSNLPLLSAWGHYLAKDCLVGQKLNPKAETRLESRKKTMRNSLTIQLKAKINDEMGVADHACKSNLLTPEQEDWNQKLAQTT